MPSGSHFGKLGEKRHKATESLQVLMTAFLKGILLQQVHKFQKNRKINMQFRECD
jgi:hypothetical protein